MQFLVAVDQAVLPVETLNAVIVGVNYFFPGAARPKMFAPPDVTGGPAQREDTAVGSLLTWKRRRDPSSKRTTRASTSSGSFDPHLNGPIPTSAFAWVQHPPEVERSDPALMPNAGPCGSPDFGQCNTSPQFALAAC
jgi:hypothetical protein